MKDPTLTALADQPRAASRPSNNPKTPPQITVLALSVKPLLLYYGVLSCCRGVILASNPQKKEESLKPRHGLETVGWQNTLSGGIRNVLELRVQANDGTFRELVEVCWPLKTLHMFSGATNDMCSTGQLLGDVKFA